MNRGSTNAFKVSPCMEPGLILNPSSSSSAFQVRNVDRALENESGTNPNEVAFVLNLICDQLWCHRNSSRGAGEDITV